MDFPIIANLPVAFDYHGNIPLHVPFSEIKSKDIHIYLDLDTKVGTNTCGQSCTHCWFVNYEKVHKKSFNTEEGILIKRHLEEKGFKVFARYVDSFAYQGEFMRQYGPAHNREFRQEEDYHPTKTMLKGDAWTSGRPLLGQNYLELLKLAVESGYGTISITYHGILNDNLSLRPQEDYPIKGVFHGKHFEVVAKRIAEFNLGQDDNNQLRLNVGITIGTHNYSMKSLLRYVEYFNKLGVATVRFNNFTDHGGRHPSLPLTQKQVEDTYRNFKWIHDHMALNFQLAISEDFGSFGIEVMNFPSHVGQCQAGKQLFTIIPSEEKILRKYDDYKIDKIGDIVGCVNIFEPTFGKLLRATNLSNNEVIYSLEFDHLAIDEFAEKRVKGLYKNGCFAKELKNEIAISLTSDAKKKVKYISEQVI
jgi:hypothetical protein